MPETIQHQYIREAPEIEALKLGLIESAKTLTGEDRELTLPEQQIAGFSPLQEAGFELAQAEGGIGGYQPYLTTGAATLGTGLGTLGTGLGTLGTAAGTLGTAAGTLGQAPTAIQAAQAAIPGTGGLFAPSDLSAYMNPYQQSVIDTTMAELNRQGDIARNQLGAQGVGAGAYGGSRFGIQGAELDRNLQDARARALAQLNQQNYGQALQTAQSAYEQQQQRQQQQSQLYGGIAQLYGGLAGQQAGIGAQQAGIGAQQAGIGMQQAGIGGQQLGAGQFAQQAGLRDLTATQQLGQQQQALQQSILDAERGNLQRQMFEPYSRLSYLSDIYKGAPSTHTSLGSQTSPTPPQPSMLQQVGSFGTGLLGTAAAAKQLGGLFS